MIVFSQIRLFLLEFIDFKKIVFVDVEKKFYLKSDIVGKLRPQPQ